MPTTHAMTPSACFEAFASGPVLHHTKRVVCFATSDFAHPIRRRCERVCGRSHDRLRIRKGPLVVERKALTLEHQRIDAGSSPSHRGGRVDSNPPRARATLL